VGILNQPQIPDPASELVFSAGSGSGSLCRNDAPPKTIIRKLREAEVLQGLGRTIAQVVKLSGITEPAFYRWLWFADGSCTRLAPTHHN
jgi:hypothetical protein